MTIWDIGDQPTITATIRNVGGTLVDPTSVAVKFINPGGTQTTSSASSASTGIWTWTFPSAFDQSGRWRVKFLGTGSVVCAEEIELLVRATEFT